MMLCVSTASVLNAGAVDDPAEVNSQYKDTNSNKIAGFASQSSLLSDDSMQARQEPHIAYPSLRGHKKIM